MESILVTKTDDNYYAIKQGDKSSNHLGYDEMLGLFAALSMPENRPCLNWMKTDAQHKAELWNIIERMIKNPESLNANIDNLFMSRFVLILKRITKIEIDRALKEKKYSLEEALTKA